MNEQTKQVAQVTTTTPAQMLQIAVEQGADLEKLERLMDLQERWETKEAKKAYTAAMNDFRARCPVIIKTRTAHNSKYAGLAETIDQIKTLLAECGLSHSWTTDVQAGVITVTCRVTHVAGHSEETSLPGPADATGSKNAIQAVGSTITYLQRYTLFAILGLAAQEDDTDGNMDTPPDALEAINSAETVEALQAAFKTAWATYPKARKELTGAKDVRKRQLLEAQA